MRPRHGEGPGRARAAHPRAGARRPLRGARGEDRRRPRAGQRRHGHPAARRAGGSDVPTEGRNALSAGRRARVRRARGRAAHARRRRGADHHRRAEPPRSRRLRGERRAGAAGADRPRDHRPGEGRDRRPHTHPGRIERVPSTCGAADRSSRTQHRHQRARGQVVRREHLHERGVRGSRVARGPEGEAAHPISPKRRSGRKNAAAVHGLQPIRAQPSRRRTL